VGEKKSLCSDTMLGISNLHYQGAKGHIYSIYTERKYAENPLTNGKNTIYNIHLTVLPLQGLFIQFADKCYMSCALAEPNVFSCA
jgi:hypothetical protein